MNQLFKTWIAALLDDASRACCHEAVSRTGFLPLVLQPGACYALCPDGEIVALDYDPPHRFVRVQDERIRNVALRVGSERYPELRPLVPARPPDARDCPYCRGTGKVEDVRLGPELVEKVRCYCGGLGWVPASGRG